MPSLPEQHLSPLEQWRLLTWMLAHPRALIEDSVPYKYRTRTPVVAYVPPWAWVVLHVVGGLLMGIVVARR